jgi:hypothetical protein
VLQNVKDDLDVMSSLLKSPVMAKTFVRFGLKTIGPCNGGSVFSLIARSVPDISDIITSEISNSGGSIRARSRASIGFVKAAAVKPLRLKMVARGIRNHDLVMR